MDTKTDHITLLACAAGNDWSNAVKTLWTTELCVFPITGLCIYQGLFQAFARGGQITNFECLSGTEFSCGESNLGRAITPQPALV